jgi:hypothetical protein
MRQLFTLLIICLVISCESNPKQMKKILYLHHSVGNTVWRGNRNKYVYKLTRQGDIQKLFNQYNKKHKTNYEITQQAFPKQTPYGWKNYPYDYYNIWVKHAGEKPFMEEPTLEILTKEYDVIMFKHCFPVSNIQADQDSSGIDSEYKSIANYKLQYEALRDKMHQFPKVKFIVWTGAAQVKHEMSKEEAERAKEFFTWVTQEWDIPGDNIFVWDFYQLQTRGNLYFADELAQAADDSHPNHEFAGFAAKLLFNRMVDIIENEGLKTSLTGEKK